jgi:eukaryotic-like serine/threonine-protein kinase
VERLSPGTVIDRYEIVEVIGEGGMATVYKALHRILGSTHALKVLDPTLARDDALRERFLSEGRIQATLNHPNIVSVTDIVATPGVAGLVAEFIDGEDLATWIERRGGTADVARIKEVFLPIFDALDAAHDRGIIHRDMKPSNIILQQRQDGSVHPKVLDFGIAKVLGDGPAQRKRATKTGTRLGTVYYMSPEQIRGASDLDARTDVFALAATLYEFVTGDVPFDGGTDFDTMKQIVDGKPVPVRSRTPDVDPIIEACIIKGLAADRASRFESCRAFAALMRGAGSASPSVRTTVTHPSPARPEPARPAPRPVQQESTHTRSDDSETGWSPLSAQPPSRPSPPSEECPPTHMENAIATTLCCCIPAGIVSIVYASKVKTLWNAGDYEGAAEASNNAKTWYTVAVCGGLAIIGLNCLIGMFSGGY